MIKTCGASVVPESMTFNLSTSTSLRCFDKHQYHRPAAAFSFAKLGVPKPVTGSQPDVALKPELVKQPQLLPFVISLNADAAVEYSHGFKKPRGGLPWSKDQLVRPIGYPTGTHHRDQRVIEKTDNCPKDRG
jgi:hypothetical protein